MDLVWEASTRRWPAQTWLYEMDMALAPNAVTVLLGATQAGKPARDHAHHGRAGCAQWAAGCVDGRGCDRHAGARAQRGHGVPAVHQLPVDDGGENIASPLKRARREESARAGRSSPSACASTCSSTARRPRLRGSQQRAAMARALAKGAPLMPRRAAGQPRLQAARGAARRADPAVRRRRIDRGLRHHRAGRGAAAGRLHRRAGRRRITAAVRPDGRVFHAAVSLAWRAFSDPPMNLLPAAATAAGVRLAAGASTAARRCRHPPAPR